MGVKRFNRPSFYDDNSMQKKVQVVLKVDYNSDTEESVDIDDSSESD